MTEERHYPGPGWKDIIDPLYDQCDREGIRVAQVKEKFGGLRFYVDAVPDTSDFYTKCDAAEDLAGKTCMTCGKPGELRGGGWLLTLCDEHAGGRPSRHATFITKIPSAS